MTMTRQQQRDGDGGDGDSDSSKSSDNDDATVATEHWQRQCHHHTATTVPAWQCLMLMATLFFKK